MNYNYKNWLIIYIGHIRSWCIILFQAHALLLEESYAKSNTLSAFNSPTQTMWLCQSYIIKLHFIKSYIFMAYSRPCMRSEKFILGCIYVRSVAKLNVSDIWCLQIVWCGSGVQLGDKAICLSMCKQVHYNQVL